MSGNRTVKRSGGDDPRMKGVLAVAALGVAELAIIGVLVVLPMLTVGAIETWQIALTVILLTVTSGIFVATCFVRADGKWQWRWGGQ
jgi:hypothetical protein